MRHFPLPIGKTYYQLPCHQTLSSSPSTHIFSKQEGVRSLLGSLAIIVYISSSVGRKSVYTLSLCSFNPILNFVEWVAGLGDFDVLIPYITA